MTLQWRLQWKSLIILLSLIVTMDLVLTKPYRNYEISLYSVCRI